MGSQAPGEPFVGEKNGVPVQWGHHSSKLEAAENELAEYSSALDISIKDANAILMQRQKHSVP